MAVLREYSSLSGGKYTKEIKNNAETALKLVSERLDTEQQNSAIREICRWGMEELIREESDSFTMCLEEGWLNFYYAQLFLLPHSRISELTVRFILAKLCFLSLADFIDLIKLKRNLDGRRLILGHLRCAYFHSLFYQEHPNSKGRRAFRRTLGRWRAWINREKTHQSCKKAARRKQLAVVVVKRKRNKRTPSKTRNIFQSKYLFSPRGRPHCRRRKRINSQLIEHHLATLVRR